ncbi:xylanase [Flammeovirga pectinis]|uniref:Xylanase n=1 Tax=Flammeovirga pectinis TaxID=2494373 RepID=A0A3S9NZR8_9BACT|nr:glycoside hydrolase [Flammeovirga pectinis]AZQ61410.1 xylanase [Flammeovirga pectinis]
MKLKWIYLALISLSITACNDDTTTGNEDNSLGDTTLTIKLSDKYQIIDGFGASDAWSMQHVGKWPESTKNEIADLLFSTQMDDTGSPKGIGLNIWRFNIGAGSVAQGGNSNIYDPWRRTEGFLLDNGTYDWTKQAGQRWFLQAAKQRGVDKFIGFSNSAPVQMTKNGKANTTTAQASNLATEEFENFAEYLTDVAKHLQDVEGITLDDISPVNETQWDWDSSSGQEGCPFTNAEVADLVRKLDTKITEKGLTAKIELTEAGQIDYLYTSGTNRPGKDNQIEDFYGSGSNSVAGLNHLSKSVAGHSYWTTEQSKLVPMRQQVWSKIKETDPTLKYNMSEYCIMGDNEENIDGNGRDLTIDMGLYLAKVMHYDLTEANASAWQWWIAASPYDYKDGLIYIDKSETGGSYQTSKMLYAMGNYSRFIDKGMYRVETNQLFGKTNDDPFTQKRIMSSAYATADGSKVVLVLVNYNDYEYTINFNFDGETMDNQEMKMYQTSSSKNLEYIGDQEVNAPVVITPKSITTYVISK